MSKLSWIVGHSAGVAENCLHTHTHTHTHHTQWEPVQLGAHCSLSTVRTKATGGLPWWRSGWESACQCRGHGFEPWSGKIPHAAEQLSPCTTTTEPAHLELVLCNKRGRDSERPTHRDEEWPPLAATRESPRTETETQHSQKLKKKKKKKATGGCCFMRMCRVNPLEEEPDRRCWCAYLQWLKATPPGWGRHWRNGTNRYCVQNP